MIQHEVVQGEDMISIAAKYGFNWESVYNNAANQRLKEMRPNPMCLAPGDIVYIPESEPISDSYSTNQSHRIEIEVPKVYFNLVLWDEENKPLSNIPFKLIVGSNTYEGKSDGEGAIRQEIPPNSQIGQLTLQPDPADAEYVLEYRVKFGQKDPNEEISGFQTQLKNLYIYSGDIDGDFGYKTKNALINFQREFSLKTTGNLDDASAKKLNEL